MDALWIHLELQLNEGSDAIKAFQLGREEALTVTRLGELHLSVFLRAISLFEKRRIPVGRHHLLHQRDS